MDVTVVQDGLHHLQNPVHAFTEMLRISSVGVMFFEPHDSLVGRLIGTRWERHGNAVNYVFRWTRRLVEDVASSYLGEHSFVNLSFGFWHHNVVLERLARPLGRKLGLAVVRGFKGSFDRVLAAAGNQFCGLVLKKPQRASTRSGE